MLPTRAVRAVSAPSRDVRTSVESNTSPSKDTNIQVVVRLRPPNDRELASGKVNLIKVVGKDMLTFDPKESDWTTVCDSKQRLHTGDKKTKDLLFAFDSVFDGDSTNEQVFENTTKTALDSVLKGYNCSVFAYGATSAGKTHTMLGSPDNPGVIFLTVMELYKRLMQREDEFDSDISVSYLEIYNETCKDLLLPAGSLAVRESEKGGVCVTGLSLHKPKSAEELLEMLHYGNQNRTQHPTDANKQSSRSHAVFQVFVRQSRKSTGLKSDVTYAKISLVDLAGSERATVTTNQGDRLREGANINKSLLALGNCINALAENNSKTFIPYRDSKLTRLLKDSLGGNCLTIMIAAVSPSVISYEDTYNTLKYANRAKSIKASLTANTANVDAHVSQYTKIIADLEVQVADLKKKLSEKEEVLISAPAPLAECSSCAEKTEVFSILHGYEKELQALFKSQCSMKQNLVDSEGLGKELSLKLLHKERSFKRLEHISEIAGSVPQHAEEKLNKFKSSYDAKQAHFMKQKVLLSQSFDGNSEKLARLQEQVDSWADGLPDNFIPIYLKMLYNLKEFELKYVSVKAQCKYLRKQLPMLEADGRANEQLIAHLLKIISSQQRKLNIQMDGSQCEAEVQSPLDMKDLPQSLVEGTKIAWADQTFTVDGCQGNMAQFEASPFKTPSRKPSVLRQIVMESRNNTSEQTQRNTILNAQRIQASTPLLTPLQGGTPLPHDDQTEKNTILNSKPVLATTPLPTATPLHLNFNVADSPDIVNNTRSLMNQVSKTPITSCPLSTSFIVSKTPGPVTSPDPVTSLDPVTSPDPVAALNSTVVLHSGIPDCMSVSNVPGTVTKSRPRTPSLNIENTTNNGDPVLCNTYRKKSHRRSLSDGHTITKKRPTVSRMLSPKKILYPSNKIMSSKKRPPKFAPMRGPGRPPVRAAAVAAGHNQKENVEPVSRQVKVKRLKSNLPAFAYKRPQVDQHQRTFRL